VLGNSNENINLYSIWFNEKENIRRCFDSSIWADEIIVVDSKGYDRKVEIVKEYTDKVYQSAWSGYIDQKTLPFQRLKMSGY